MKYIDNWEKIKARYREAWALENHDRPLMNVTCWEQHTPVLNPPQEIEKRWLDEDYVVKAARYSAENQYYCGEAYPAVFTNLGPDIFAALYGAPLKFGEDTSWSEHNVSDWDDAPDFGAGFVEKWHKKLISLTEAMTEESKGDYLVGITDIHPGMDALVAMRGPAELCLDLYDCPEKIEPLPMRLFEGFKRLYTELYGIVNRYEKGATTWMKIYSEERFYVTSCDFICMISEDDFDRYVREELCAEAAWLDRTVFHLDGPGALRHLDAILRVPGIGGIQWVPGAGAPPVGEWPEVLQKVQRAGKMLQLHVDSEAELKQLSEVVKPEGVVIDCTVKDRFEADALIKAAERYWRKKG